MPGGVLSTRSTPCRQPVCQLRPAPDQGSPGTTSLAINSCSHSNPSWGMLSRCPVNGWILERRADWSPQKAGQGAWGCSPEDQWRAPKEGEGSPCPISQILPLSREPNSSSSQPTLALPSPLSSSSPYLALALCTSFFSKCTSKNSPPGAGTTHRLR